MAESIVSFFEHGCFRQKPSRFRGVLSRIIKACPEIPAPLSNNPLKRFDTLQSLAYRRVPNRPFKKTITHYFAGVAQSVEQLIRNEKVACSIHVSGTTFIKDPNCPGLFLSVFPDLCGSEASALASDCSRSQALALPSAIFLLIVQPVVQT